MPFGLKRFVRFATAVWSVSPLGKTDEQIALEGLGKMESWLKELGLALSITELGVTSDMIESIKNSCRLKPGGYLKLTYDDIVKVLKASL